MMRAIALLPATLILAACANHQPVSSVTHAPRAPASIPNWSPPPTNAYFKSFTLEDLRTVMRNYTLATGEPLPSIKDVASKPLGPEIARRAQMVVREITEMLDLKGVPEPRIVIAEDNVIEAYSVATYACLNTEATINDGTNTTASLDIDNFGDHPQRIQTSRGHGCLDVKNRPESFGSFNEVVSNPTTYHDVSCDHVGTGPNFRCPHEGIVGVRAKTFAWRLQTPYIIIHAGLLGALNDWDEFDAMLAHELGHYYRIHPLRFNDYQYFYDRNRSLTAFNPERTNDLRETESALQNIRKLRIGPGFPGFFKSSVSGEVLARLLKSSAPNLKTKSCEDFESFGNLPALPFKDDRSAGMKKFLTRLQDCFKSVRIGEATTDTYLDRYFAPGDRILIDFFDKAAAKTPAASLWQAFTIADQAVTTGASKFKKSPDLRRTGYYTTEEDADVFSIHYMVSRGSGIEPVRRMLIHIMEVARTTADSELKQDIDVCLAAEKRGWKTLGRPFKPVIDDLMDLHHSLCYRLYNAELLQLKTNAAGGENIKGLKREPELPYSEVKAAYGAN